MLTSVDGVAALALSGDLVPATLVRQLEHRSAGGSAEHRDDLPRRRDLRQEGPMPLAIDYREERKRVDVDRCRHRIARTSAGALKADVLAGSSNARRSRALAVSW